MAKLKSAGRIPNSTRLRWEAFCREYMVDKDATRAAGAAGYAATANSGCALLRKPWIRERVRQLAKAQAERLELQADDVLREIAKVAMRKVPTKGAEKMKALELLAKHFRLLEPEGAQVQVSAGAVQVVIQAVGAGVPGQIAMGPPSDETGGPKEAGGVHPHGQAAPELGEGKEHPQICEPPTPQICEPPTPDISNSDISKSTSDDGAPSDPKGPPSK